MAQVVVTAAADDDLGGILIYLAAKAGRRTAEKYNDLFESLFDRLATHPAIGAPRPGLGQSIRVGIVSPYTVIYQHTDDENLVTVLRIVYGRRRITGKLLVVPAERSF